jgi:nitrate/nitrite transport system substrate-binding protein
LHEASTWLDIIENRKEQCEIISAASYVNCPQEIIYDRLIGNLEYGDDRSKKDEDYMIFSGRNCNYPQLKYAQWWLTQLRRWGMVEAPPDYDGIAKSIMAPSLYEEAMKEIGYSHPGADATPEALFDGSTFDPSKSEAYATSFSINNLKG